MSKVVELLRDKACYYLDHTCETIDKSLIHVPSPDTIDKIWIDSENIMLVVRCRKTGECKRYYKDNPYQELCEDIVSSC